MTLRWFGGVCVPLFLLALFVLPVCAEIGIVQEDGVCWFVDNDGNRFYSRGVTTVNGSVPSEKSRAGQAYYYGRYYSNKAEWRDDTAQRLRSWGFNTLGGWSDADPALNMPIAVELDLGRQAQLHWFDVFAPETEHTVQRLANELTAAYKDHPQLLGFFSDNEVGWWNAPLFRWYLKQPWSNWTKRTLFAFLYQRYEGRFDMLCRDFVPGDGVTTFGDLKHADVELRLQPGGQGIATVNAFTALVAGRYYDLTWRALKKADPEALVLGDRLPLYYNQDAVLAAQGKVDILSSNYNVDTEDGWVAPYYFEGLAKLNAAPVLVSEFFFAANENRSGNSNNGHLMHVDTQAERAAGAAQAVINFSGFPNVIGAHWFQYTDEPTGGRNDGEDFNMGLVDIHNIPYEQLVSAMTQANQQTSQHHALSAECIDVSYSIQVPRLAGPIDVTDNTLTDWKNKKGTRLTGWGTDAPYVPFGDVHIGWRPEGMYLFHIGQSYVDFGLAKDPEQFDPTDCYRLEFTVVVDGVSVDRVYSLIPQRHHLYPERFEPVLYVSTSASGDHPVQAAALGTAQILEKPLPHIALEAFIPASELVGHLGLTKIESDIKITCRIRVTSFFHEHVMWLRSYTETTGMLSVDTATGRVLALSDSAS
ncbi:hypothetical protein [Desulfovibrio inopinatus]|uniref:hypothetical protein n=1 Tax=Desulfovibrio inopinatus TaxID=102109 RepID=UPI00040061B8|nr:hypothetical protein [Desulfovibrio inopinatus]